MSEIMVIQVEWKELKDCFWSKRKKIHIKRNIRLFEFWREKLTYLR